MCTHGSKNEVSKPRINHDAVGALNAVDGNRYPYLQNTVVVTEAIQVVDGGTAADQQAAVGSDSEGKRTHRVDSKQPPPLLFYDFTTWRHPHRHNPNHQIQGLHKIWHPDMVIDEMDRVHIVWTDKSQPTQNRLHRSQPLGSSYGRLRKRRWNTQCNR